MCDDEIYFFPSSIVPLKVASPSLVELVGRVASQPHPDEQEESLTAPFDESSNQMDTSFGDSFAAHSHVTFRSSYKLCHLRVDCSMIVFHCRIPLMTVSELLIPKNRNRDEEA